MLKDKITLPYLPYNITSINSQTQYGFCIGNDYYSINAETGIILHAYCERIKDNEGTRRTKLQ